MLIKFEVENFRSIKTKKIFYTVERDSNGFPNHVYKYDDNLSILKTTAIYGPNGSGKTTLFKALYFIKMLIEDANYLKPGKKQNKLFFPFRLDENMFSNDSTFQVDFISNNLIYIYSLSINFESQKITSEELKKYDSNTNTEQIVFRRHTHEKNIEVYQTLLSFGAKNIDEYLPIMIPKYSTLLSNQLLDIQNKDFRNAQNWFKNKLSFLFPVYEFGEIAYILNLKANYLDLASKIIKYSTIGINRLEITKVAIETYLGSEKEEEIKAIESILEEKEYFSFQDSNDRLCTAIKNNDNRIIILRLVIIHKDKKGKDVAFELDQESNGTISLLHLIPALILSYGEGVNYFIDDINTFLHPILLREILAQYLGNNLEKANGQLIFNSHEDFLLDRKIFREDEIWLSEKDENGESDFFPLTDFQEKLDASNLKRDYLNGKFGGVPFETDPGKLIFE